MSEVLWRAAVATLVAMIGAGMGVAAQAATGRTNALVSAAGGALLAMTLVSLLPEASHLITLPELALGVASGYGLLYLIGKYVFPICPACAATTMETRAAHRLEGAAVLLALAVTFHAVMDGIAVALGYEEHVVIGLPLLIAVSFHKFPEGLALSSLLLRAGYSAGAALAWTLGIELTTLVGAVLGVWFFHGISTFWLGLLLAHAAGGFLYLALHALVGSAPGRATQMGYGGLGFATVAVVLWSLRRLPH